TYVKKHLEETQPITRFSREVQSVIQKHNHVGLSVLRSITGFDFFPVYESKSSKNGTDLLTSSSMLIPSVPLQEFSSPLFLETMENSVFRIATQKDEESKRSLPLVVALYVAISSAPLAVSAIASVPIAPALVSAVICVAVCILFHDSFCWLLLDQEYERAKNDFNTWKKCLKSVGEGTSAFLHKTSYLTGEEYEITIFIRGIKKTLREIFLNCKPETQDLFSEGIKTDLNLLEETELNHQATIEAALKSFQG
ncbi:MAG: hypothetical protein AAGF04_05470, partial [Chlamydiota bacterium]